MIQKCSEDGLVVVECKRVGLKERTFRRDAMRLVKHTYSRPYVMALSHVTAEDCRKAGVNSTSLAVLPH